MPNAEYDIRTPEEKKKLLKKKLNVGHSNTENDDKIPKKDSAEYDKRGGLHRHSA